MRHYLLSVNNQIKEVKPLANKYKFTILIHLT